MLLFLDFNCTHFGINTKDFTLLSKLLFRIFRHEHKTIAFQCTAHGRVPGCFCNDQIRLMAETPILLHAPLSQLPLHVHRLQHRTPYTCISFYSTTFVMSRKKPRSSVQHTGGFQAALAPTRSHRWLKFQSSFFLDFYCTHFGINTKDSTPLSKLPFRIFRHEQKTIAIQCTAHGRVQSCPSNDQIRPMAESPILLHAPLPRLLLHILRLQHKRLHAPVFASIPHLST